MVVVRPNWGLVAVGMLGVGLMIVLPLVLDLFGLLQITLYAIFGILALSLAFIWGYGGILCFGHSAFFGLGAYAYAVAVINIGESTVPLLIAMALPALLAAALGYFMFYARISDIYVGVITLTLTLIFYNCINATAGAAYHIGDAMLGGFNGMPNIPSLNIPFLPDETLEPLGMFLLCSALLLIVYFALHALLATRFGRVLVAIRENEQRVEFLGYDARFHKLVAFAIGGALAGLAGCLYVAWGNYVSPPVFSVVQSAQIIIWLMVGGAGTLLGPVIGAMAMSWLTVRVGTQQLVNANVVLGAVLLIFVLLVPRGLGPTITERLVPWLLSWRRSTLAPREMAQGSKA
jgi:urea transport system permease protein